jgi:hypothetical protein
MSASIGVDPVTERATVTLTKARVRVEPLEDVPADLHFPGAEAVKDVNLPAEPAVVEEPIDLAAPILRGIGLTLGV